MATDTDRLTDYREAVNSENILLLFFLIISAGAYWIARDFTFGGSVFPRLTAIIVFVGCLLVIVGDYLPKSVQPFITGSVEFVDQDEIDPDEESASPEVDTSLPRFQKPLGPVLFTTVMILLYAAVGYAIGFLWATPVFAGVYIYWFDKPLLYVIAIAAIAFAIAYVFISVFGVRLHEGAFVTIGEDIAPAMLALAAIRSPAANGYKRRRRQ